MIKMGYAHGKLGKTGGTVSKASNSGSGVRRITTPTPTEQPVVKIDISKLGKTAGGGTLGDPSAGQIDMTGLGKTAGGGAIVASIKTTTPTLDTIQQEKQQQQQQDQNARQAEINRRDQEMQEFKRIERTRVPDQLRTQDVPPADIAAHGIREPTPIPYAPERPLSIHPTTSFEPGMHSIVPSFSAGMALAKGETPTHDIVLPDRPKEEYVTREFHDFMAEKSADYRRFIESKEDVIKDVVGYGLAPAPSGATGSREDYAETFGKIVVGAAQMPAMLGETVGAVPLGAEHLIRHPIQAVEMMPYAAGVMAGGIATQFKEKPFETTGEIGAALLTGKLGAKVPSQIKSKVPYRIGLGKPKNILIEAKDVYMPKPKPEPQVPGLVIKERLPTPEAWRIYATEPKGGLGSIFLEPPAAKTGKVVSVLQEQFYVKPQHIRTPYGSYTSFELAGVRPPAPKGVPLLEGMAPKTRPTISQYIRLEKYKKVTPIELKMIEQPVPKQIPEFPSSKIFDMPKTHPKSIKGKPVPELMTPRARITGKPVEVPDLGFTPSVLHVARKEGVRQVFEPPVALSEIKTYEPQTRPPQLYQAPRYKPKYEPLTTIIQEAQTKTSIKVEMKTKDVVLDELIDFQTVRHEQQQMVRQPSKDVPKPRKKVKVAERAKTRLEIDLEKIPTYKPKKKGLDLRPIYFRKPESEPRQATTPSIFPTTYLDTAPIPSPEIYPAPQLYPQPEPTPTPIPTSSPSPEIYPAPQPYPQPEPHKPPLIPPIYMPLPVPCLIPLSQEPKKVKRKKKKIGYEDPRYWPVENPVSDLWGMLGIKR